MKPGLSRVSVAVVVVFLASCSGTPVGGGGLQVLVELRSGLRSQCVKVFATDGAGTRASGGIKLAGKSSPLHVGVVPDGLGATVTLHAQGYLDEGCTQETPGELSDAVDGTFASPPAVVTLVLQPVAQLTEDGGVDGGSDAGVDAGQPDAGPPDAGVDADHDGYTVEQGDCDDTDPNRNPGELEVCNDGISNDCDSQVDCEELTCDQFPCLGGGKCMGGVCVQAVESMCNDGLDNDGDGLADCLDPNCTGATCSDSNACTTGDTCAADGGCVKTGDVACMTPPSQCFSTAGTCLPDAGASCDYAPRTGGCDDGLACTTNDSCAAGACTGTPLPCGPAPTCRAPGNCNEPSGTCTFAPLPVGTGSCNDGDNCTTGDACDGDGGCRGTPVTCTPTQCQTNNGCSAGGMCQFNPRTGQSCDAGTGAPATCDSNANCVATPAGLFPYTPSNFTEAQLPMPDGGALLNVNCDVVIDTSPGTPSITGACFPLPPFAVITPSGGQQTVVFGLNSLNVNALRTITVRGNKPVIFAVVGNVQLDGTLRAENAGGTAGACSMPGNPGTQGGGGGGGFGSAGGNGGNSSSATTGGSGGSANGGANLVPLRGGCNGRAGNSGGAAGTGGGAVQISATGAVNIAGVLTAPGRAGSGAAQGGNGGGGAGSGGGLLVEGASISVGGLARVTANGGGGGEGSRTSSAGNDGADGETLGGSGGLGGFGGTTNGGNGGQGAGRTNGNAGNGSTAGDGNSGGGGGGGGVGRVRFNAVSSCSVTFGAVVSPQASSGGAAMCP